MFFICCDFVNARSGCCSYHGGVCGCGCCDGTALSSTCAPYYPECSGGYNIPSYSTYTSCPANSYEYLGGCKCNSGYVAQNGSCISGYTYCMNQDFNSTYDYLSGSCKCNTGYVINSLGNCENGNSVCHNKYGYYSSYDSLSKSCKCDSRYILENNYCISFDDYCKNRDYNSVYDVLSDGCKCKNDYVINSIGKCDLGDNVCDDKYGNNSYYDSITNTCKCDSGYYLIDSECKRGEIVYIIKVYSSISRAIIRDSKSNYYLIEYGIGCSSYIGKYEGILSKLAFVEKGGFFIDGINDNLFLLDDDLDCKIFNGKDINIGDYNLSNNSTNSTNNLINKKCPSNSTLDILENQCHCNVGYGTDAKTGKCVFDKVFYLENKAKKNGKEKISGPSQIKLYKNIEKIGNNLWGNKK